MRTLYFDCYAGASGDMILGALVDAGAGRDALIKELSKLPVPAFEVDFGTVDRSGLSSTKACVKVPHEHNHRNLLDIERIVDSSCISFNVKVQVKKIFRALGEAEARVHGTEKEKVHFHEVGAMDSIVDIVGCCIGFELLGIERFVCSKVNVGTGFVKMAHGTFPVPPPAVAELLKGVPIYSNDIEGELVTPTGAAIISTVCESYGPIPEIKGEVIGYGAGTREYKGFPNALRILIGETDPREDSARERLVLLETNLDDLSPQVSGYVMERAFQLGALDCWFTPIQMKKNRPAVMLSILCENRVGAEIKEMVFRETSTLGVRARDVEREELEREMKRVNTRFGEIRVKIGRFNGEIVNLAPEFEDVKRLALECGATLSEVRNEALRAWTDNSEKPREAIA